MSFPATVYLVGAGPGDPDLLTVKAHNLLSQAEVVIYDRLVSAEIMALAPQTALLISVGKAPKRHSVPQERINEILAEQALAGRMVIRLKGGDPLIFGRGSEEAAHLRTLGIPVEYVPGITAAQGASSSTGIPLTHRGVSGGVRYITGHRAADEPLDFDWPSLATGDTTLVVYMGAANIGEISHNLVAHGLSGDTPVMAISCATTPAETRLIADLDQISLRVGQADMPAPMLFIIGQVVSLYPGQVAALASRYQPQEVAHA
jgi:uroporphyrin-III C-methyltransferase